MSTRSTLPRCAFSRSSGSSESQSTGERSATCSCFGSRRSMMGAQMPTEFLFSYGTLQLEAVQMATFGRLLTGTRDVLPGFEAALLEIDDPATVSLSGKTHHAIAKFTGQPARQMVSTETVTRRGENERRELAFWAKLKDRH